MIVHAGGEGRRLPAYAAEGDGFGPQAEWAQKYDSDPRLQVQRSSTPVLSAQTISATEQAIQTYQGIVAKGGWGTLPNGASLHVGSKSQVVAALRRRLRRVGSALRQDQRHGLPTGP